MWDTYRLSLQILCVCMKETAAALLTPFLFVKYAVPVPFKELRINVILTRSNKRIFFDGEEILVVVVFANVLF